MGQDMTRSITLPLLGIGAAAVKSAADLETLETQFVSLTGGAAQASKMVAQLNEFTAATPFQLEEVGNAARQLIASGTAISEVNDQLQFLGDIAATSGSSINDIAAIFAKVNAKGKVELESLNQLAERGIPIFAELAEATGLPADKLGAGAVSVEQFNDVLKSFSKEGGFAAGAMERLSETAAGKFSTALDNLKLAGAELAKDLLPVVKDLIDDLTTFTKRVQTLSPEGKKLALQIAAIAAAIGPVLVVLPKLVSSFTLVRTAFIALNAAMLANPFAIVATGIALVVSGLILLNQKTNEQVTAVTQLAKANQDLSLAQQKLNVEKAIEDQQKLVDLLKLEKEAKDKIAEKFGGKAIKEQKEANKAFEEANAQLLEMRNMLVEIDTGLENIASTDQGVASIATKLDTSAEAMAKLTTRTIAQTKANKELQQSTWNVGMMVDQVNVKMANFAEAVQQSFQRAAEAVAMSVGQMIGSMAIGTTKPEEFANSLLSVFANLATELGKLAIGYGIAIKGIKESLKTLNPIMATVAGIALIALGAGLQGAIQQRAEVAGMPALANGGLAYGPTTALVGDNRNARIDPEVIAPLSKLKDMMSSNAVEVFGRISGSDIYLSNTRTTTDRQRYA
jgi:tape measure domain-containing protein